MKIHEYQAKEILASFGVPVPPGKVADTVDEAVRIAGELGGDAWVVKAQIHAGGRGKGGGVKLAKSLDEVRARASEILGMQLVTPQTGPGGQTVRKVLVTAACGIAKEYYAGVVLDRASGVPVLMVSAEGGMDIEEVAAKTPERIFKEPVDPVAGLAPYQGRRLARALGWPSALVNAGADLLRQLVRAYLDSDGSLAEINPLVLTDDGKLVALDAKFSLDDNAEFRHPDIAAMRDIHEEDPLERRAGESDLSYIKLDGTIGCMVNGAGLAMATLDIINHFGAQPANFLDVGGGANAKKVQEALEIILEDPGVKGILINIFGGIMRCDTIAEGVIEAAKNIELRVPVVVRLEGTNVDEGKRLLAESGLPLVSAKDLADAARRIVELAAA